MPRKRFQYNAVDAFGQLLAFYAGTLQNFLCQAGCLSIAGFGELPFNIVIMGFLKMGQCGFREFLDI